MEDFRAKNFMASLNKEFAFTSVGLKRELGVEYTFQNKKNSKGKSALTSCWPFFFFELPSWLCRYHIISVSNIVMIYIRSESPKLLCFRSKQVRHSSTTCEQCKPSLRQIPRCLDLQPITLVTRDILGSCAEQTMSKKNDQKHHSNLNSTTQCEEFLGVMENWNK